MKIKNIYILILLLILAACGNPNYDMRGMFNGSSPEVATRFDQSIAYNDSVGETHLLVPANYHVYVCTDSHIDTTHRNLERFVIDYKSDPLCPLAIHLGDLVNANGHYPHAYQVLQTEIDRPHQDTLFLTPGNHDIYFNQWTDYRHYFHTSVYWFDTRDEQTGKPLDLFICLDSSEGTLGYDQIQWLRNILSSKQKEGYRHTIVFTHTHMFKQDASQGHTSNFSMEETYEIIAILSKYNVDMYWSGHDHLREITRYAGTEYIIVNALQDKEKHPYYMVVEISQHIDYHFVSLL